MEWLSTWRRNRRNNMDTSDSVGDSVLESPSALEWTCHVCGDKRPDNKISVYSKKVKWSTGVEITQNVRYCNDRRECIDGVLHIDFVEEARS